MRFMLRTIALAAVVTLVGASGLLGQVVPTPAPTVPSQVGEPSMATPQVESVPPVLPTSTRNAYGTYSNLGALRGLGMMTGSDASAVLVVPAGKISTEYLATANQDMTVMARILRNALGQAQPAGMDFDDRYGLGGIFVGQNSQNMQNIYLQGFGALFTMKVNFPLAPGPDEEENTPQEQADPDVDPVWQDTQRAIFDPEGARRRRETDEQVVKYDAEKVEKLKTSLIAALKHAVNIRCLAPEEVVVITVSGEAVRGDIVSMQTLPGANSILVTTKDGKTKIYRGSLPEEMNVLTPTALTFRAKVSDIKAYAERNMTVESFRQKVQIIDHPQLDTANGNTVTTSITTGYRK